MTSYNKSSVRPHKEYCVQALSPQHSISEIDGLGKKAKSKKAKKQKAAFCCCHDCPLYINVTMPSSSIFSLDNMVKHTLRKVPGELQVKSHIFSWFTRGWKLLCTKTASKRCQYWRFSTTTGGISILTTTIDPQGPY